MASPGEKAFLDSSPFLSPGQTFRGEQQVNVSNRDDDKWTVHVTIEGVDLERGTLCGSMEAINVPTAVSSVLTFWEGEIIDGINHNFITGKWDASLSDDMVHWSIFPPFATMIEKRNFPSDPRLNDILCGHEGLSNSRYVFMRWKELFFEEGDSEGSGLSICGFYYCCLDRLYGSIDGIYFDVASTPFQKLILQPQGWPSMTCTDYAFR